MIQPIARCSHNSALQKSPRIVMKSPRIVMKSPRIVMAKTRKAA